MLKKYLKNYLTWLKARFSARFKVEKTGGGIFWFLAEAWSLSIILSILASGRDEEDEESFNKKQITQ